MPSARVFFFCLFGCSPFDGIQPQSTVRAWHCNAYDLYFPVDHCITITLFLVWMETKKQKKIGFESDSGVHRVYLHKVEDEPHADKAKLSATKLQVNWIKELPIWGNSWCLFPANAHTQHTSGNATAARLPVHALSQKLLLNQLFVVFFFSKDKRIFKVRTIPNGLDSFEMGMDRKEREKNRFVATY